MLKFAKSKTENYVLAEKLLGVYMYHPSIFMRSHKIIIFLLLFTTIY